MYRRHTDKEDTVVQNLDSNILSEGDQFGRFTIIEHVYQGGQGHIYKAHADEEQPVALKVRRVPETRAIDPRLTERLRREADVLRRLERNPLTVNLLEDHTDEEIPYMVLEFLEGFDLLKELELKHPFDIRFSIQVAIKVLAALRHLHSLGLVYRDLKLDNIILARGGHLKMVDFGLVGYQQRVATEDLHRLTKEGRTMGACDNMSPEQACSRPLDNRSDLYSVGCMLYTMLVGVTPYYSPYEREVMEFHVWATPKRLPKEHRWHRTPICDIVHKAMQKKPEDRFCDASQMIRALWSYYDSLDPTTS